MKNFEIGGKLKKDRYSIEEIALCNHSSLYPYGREDPVKESNGYEWCYFYYYGDDGVIYRTKLETYNGVRASEVDDCVVEVEVVGLLPEHSSGNYLFMPK